MLFVAHSFHFTVTWLSVYCQRNCVQQWSVNERWGSFSRSHPCRNYSSGGWMCDNELIRANPQAFCCFISKLSTRDALDGRPPLLSSCCPLTGIGFFAHDLKNTFACLCHADFVELVCTADMPQMRLSNQKRAKLAFKSRFMVDILIQIYRNVFFHHWSVIKRKGYAVPPLWPTLRWEGQTWQIMEISITVTPHTHLPLLCHSQYSTAVEKVHTVCAVWHFYT